MLRSCWQEIIGAHNNPRVLFYHILTSEVRRHNHVDYLAGAYVFTGLGLTAIAGTEDSGSVGAPIFYESPLLERQ